MERCLFSKITTTMSAGRKPPPRLFLGLVAARTFGSLVQARCRIGDACIEQVVRPADQRRRLARERRAGRVAAEETLNVR
jgi:hypothetical protein